jgi:toxin ParE1/3/4
MLTKLIWSNQARTDLLDIYILIGLEQPAAAERYFERDRAEGTPAAITATHGRATP